MLALVGTVLAVEDAGMNPSRLFLLIVAGCWLLHSKSLFAQDLDFASPFGPTLQFSADVVIMTKDGTTMTQKMYCDTGKVRTEINEHGMQVISIERPDLKKIYSVMVAQKMVMEMPFDPSRFKNQTAAASGQHGKYEPVGPDVVEGVACTKYRGMAAKDDKVFFFWVDAATKAPVKMASEDGSFTMLWKNYKAGPQDAALFEPPAGYQVVHMPGAPGGAGP
jgi:hypothetical protein